MVQTVILRCCKCSYLHWYKSYNMKCKFMIFSPVANLMHHPLNSDKIKRKIMLRYFEKATNLPFFWHPFFYFLRTFQKTLPLNPNFCGLLKKLELYDCAHQTRPSENAALCNDRYLLIIVLVRTYNANVVLALLMFCNNYAGASIHRWSTLLFHIHNIF